MIMLSGKDGVADADSLIEAAETIKTGFTATSGRNPD